jgi:hypothetical protein
MDRAVRVGVLGLRRGAALARLAQQAGMQVVAVCERDDRRRQAATALGAVAYRDVEPFLDHGMDAVILVNDFDQHAPVAVQALDRGLSVLSETAATGTRPVQVSGFVVPTAAGPEALERARRGRGWAAALVVRLDNGAVFKSLHGFLEAGQQAWVRLHGDRGLMENLRQGDTRTLRMVWDVEDGEGGRRAEEVYLPWPPEFPATNADPMGDGVAETLMLRDFASAVRHQRAPDQDVYFGVELSITGIQAMRSSLAGSLPVEVPDLRRPDVRRAWAADDWYPELPEL